MKSLLLRALLILIVGVALMFGQPSSIRSSALPVSVKLGGTGATSWAIGNMQPGDSGYRDVTLTNDGIVGGKADIWVNNLVGHDGTASYFEPSPPPNGDMPNHLLLSLSGPGLKSDFTMPAVVTDFPHGTTTDTHHLWINSLDSGQTVDLTWTWSLPTYVGNDVQGDSLAFDINYSLTQLYAIYQTGGGGGSGPAAPPETTQPAPASTPPIIAPVLKPPVAIPPINAQGGRIIELSVPQVSVNTGINNEGVIVGNLSAATPDRKFSLSIGSGTQVLISNANRPNDIPTELIGDTVPYKIEVTETQQDIPPYPDGWVSVSPAYNINGVTNGYITGVKMDKPAQILITYNENSLPQFTADIAIFYYSYTDGWVQLAPPAGFIASAGEEAAEVDHFTLFGVLAKSGTAAKPVLPAKFAVQRLTVVPPRILVGHSSDVKVVVANTGGIVGEYSVIVKVNDQIQKTQTVTLKPGEKREIDLTLAPGSVGSYSIQAGNINNILFVDPRPQMELIETDYWWLLFISLGAATLLISLFQKRRSKKVPSDD